MSDADTPETLGFDFAPAWARQSADEYVSRYQSKNYDERTGREERPRRDGERRPRRDGERRPRREGFDGERRPRREGFDGERRPRRDGPAGERRPRRDGAEGERRPRRDGERRPRREPVKPLEAEIRILPNQKTLGAVIKTLQGTHVAFPVKKFVNMFLENPQACLVRFEAKADTEIRFWTCKACGLVALTEAELVNHLMAEHLNDFFDVSEEDREPPSGVYPRVARCTLTGEWVGAPNHHSYRHRVAELAARAKMSENDYLRTVEMLTDEESVNAWKQSVTKETVYRLKFEAAAPASADTPVEGEAAETPAEVKDERIAYTRDQAEALFRRDILPTQITSATHVCLPVSVAQMSPSFAIRDLLRRTLREEQRYPRSLFFALRGAFRHRKFALFRANDARGPEFVANLALTPFTTEHVVPELAAALKFVTEHPMCVRSEMIAAVQAEVPEMDPSVLMRQMAFLFQKGHIVEYYNGVLALPEANPKFRKLPEEMKREREAAGKDSSAPEAPAEAAAEAAPEAPAEAAAEAAPEAPAEAAAEAAPEA